MRAGTHEERTGPYLAASALAAEHHGTHPGSGSREGYPEGNRPGNSPWSRIPDRTSCDNRSGRATPWDPLLQPPPLRVVPTEQSRVHSRCDRLAATTPWNTTSGPPPGRTPCGIPTGRSRNNPESATLAGHRSRIDLGTASPAITLASNREERDDSPDHCSKLASLRTFTAGRGYRKRLPDNRGKPEVAHRAIP